MSRVSTLDVERLNLDWGQNDAFQNHSRLYRDSDRATVPYYYADGAVSDRPAHIRSLSAMRRRLDLLGYTSGRLPRFYRDAAIAKGEFYDAPAIPFDQFAAAVRAIDLSALPPSEEDDSLRLASLTTSQLQERYDTLRSPELFSGIGTLLDDMDPYLLLGLLSENPANGQLPVIWRWAELAEGGYITEEDVYVALTPENQFLVVTEGSSDSHVLAHSLPLVAPDIADFFYFVDLAGFPFAGAGDVVRFCQGLSRIQVLNRVLVVLDNDAAGHAERSKLASLRLPKNIKVMTLPNLPEFTSVMTVGPGGSSPMDVNGRAVSIEMFLDHRHGPPGPPSVRWTAFNETSNRYQGELIRKEEYVRAFLKQQPRDSTYDLTKLRLVWDAIYATCRGEENRAAEG